MSRIEQAIFSYVETPAAAGYAIAARSPGLLDADARELSVWCPTNDALLDPEGESLNFHPLPSGAYCISRTSAAPWNGDGVPCRSQTHCLVVPSELLIRAAASASHFGPVGPSTPILEPIVLEGRADAVDTGLLHELAHVPGSANMAVLVAMARESVFLAVAGEPSPIRLIDGLLNCLPPQCRTDFSFTTGLRFSPRRPFRLAALSGDLAERLWVANHPNVAVFGTCHGMPPHSTVIDDWARLIERVLATRQIPFLAMELTKRRFDLTADDLPALGLQLIERLEPCELCGETGWATKTTKQASPIDPSRAHAAHRRFEKTVQAVASEKACNKGPSVQMDPNAPEVLERLELLDDLVYEAIRGETNAMRRLEAAWPETLAELGEPLLAESREQYLRYAMSVWEECGAARGMRDPGQAVFALDVLCLLFCDI
jgi:hypothetical protein